MSIIQTQNLTKTFKNNQALKNVSLSIETGQILGLLGPNGAGKTTLIKSLVGGIKPTSGSVKIFETNPLKNKRELSHRFGYMPQDLALYGNLSAYENIRFFAKLHKKRVLRQDIEQLLNFLGILDRKDDKVENFSGGMERRVSLATAMIHQPDILILDEPTAGLDPVLKKSLWQLFKDQAQNGKTLIVSTHLMEEALLCDSLAVMRNGQIITVDTPSNIIAEGTITIVVNFASRAKSKVIKLPSNPELIAGELHKLGLDRSIKSLQIEHESLEDTIVKIMEKQ